jgi:hypothetical protein
MIQIFSIRVLLPHFEIVVNQNLTVLKLSNFGHSFGTALQILISKH